MKILIAEDDHNTREGMCDLLEGEGFTVAAATNGNQALDIYRSFVPDLICLDIMMPGKSGYDVCREIRNKDKNIPVLFLSARSEEIDKVLGLELGADDYVSKPFSSRELVARINALLRRANPEQNKNGFENPAPFEIADLKIIPDELRAYRNSLAIDLSRREIIILYLLMENRGRVVFRQDIFDAAWGMDYLPSSRTLDQTIAQLRKKIETDHSHPGIIKTVHSEGYRWDG